MDPATLELLAKGGAVAIAIAAWSFERIGRTRAQDRADALADEILKHLPQHVEMQTKILSRLERIEERLP